MTFAWDDVFKVIGPYLIQGFYVQKRPEGGYDIKWKNSQGFKEAPVTILKDNTEYVQPGSFNWIRNNSGDPNKPAPANFKFGDPPSEEEKEVFIQAMTPIVAGLNKNHYYVIDGKWGKDVTKRLKAIQQIDDQKKSKPAAQRARKKIEDFAGAKQPKEEQKSSASIPEDRKPFIKGLQDEVEKEALANIAQHATKYGYEDKIDLEAFKKAVSLDSPVYDNAAKILLNMIRHGADPEDINVVNDFLNQRAEAQIIATLNAKTDDKESIFNNYFADRPNFTKGGLPSASDFGRMRPKDKLQYLTSSSAVIDAMNLLDKGFYKVVFNPNHLTQKGAERYAKQIGGTVAPVRDYDGDGMPDYYIYDSKGRIAVINGKRLKRDDKQVLKRIFYQSYPDPKKRKAMGGFKGWLNTVLFQVGPYNWQGQRSVRVTDKNYALLKALRDRGYLTKEVESYIPRTKKSFSSTIKTHFLDSIKYGLDYAFSGYSKAAWYLPQNYLRDFIYKLVVGTYMMRIAKDMGQFDSLLSNIDYHNRMRSTAKNRQTVKNATINEIFKMIWDSLKVS